MLMDFIAHAHGLHCKHHTRMTMNKFHFNEHKQDTWKCDWLIGHIISIILFLPSIWYKELCILFSICNSRVSCSYHQHDIRLITPLIVADIAVIGHYNCHSQHATSSHSHIVSSPSSSLAIDIIECSHFRPKGRWPSIRSVRCSTIRLTQASSNQVSFMVRARAIYVMLLYENPFALHNIDIFGMIHKFPCASINQGMDFQNHDGLPWQGLGSFKICSKQRLGHDSEGKGTKGGGPSNHKEYTCTLNVLLIYKDWFSYNL